MDFVTFGIVYLCGAAFLLFIMLFGESPAFVGTPVATLHWMLTEGICDLLQWIVRRTCGQTGEKWLDRACECCCDRPNPFLQISYVAILGIVYFMFWTQLFPLLPNPVVPEYHIYIGTALCLVCLTVFIQASRSDPGTVGPENLEQHLAAYPFDQVVWTHKECWTCKHPRPARSKHCRVCGRCVARFDHHCAWINNCVGQNNHRLFLLFLLVTALLAIYGLMLAAAILWGEVLRYDILRLVFMDHETGRLMKVADSPRRIVTWLVVNYSLPMTVCLFLTVATLLLLSFLSYQLYLIFDGRTTYETFRWRKIHRQAARAEHNAKQPPTTRMQRCWGTLFRSGRGQAALQLPNNVYDKGPFANLADVLFPSRVLRNYARPEPPQPAGSSSQMQSTVKQRTKQS